MQAMVRSVIPYIQRFLYHHDELAEVYSELIDNNIGEKIKRLCFGQVRRSGLVGLEQSEAFLRENPLFIITIEHTLKCKQDTAIIKYTVLASCV